MVPIVSSANGHHSKVAAAPSQSQLLSVPGVRQEQSVCGESVHSKMASDGRYTLVQAIVRLQAKMCARRVYKCSNQKWQVYTPTHFSDKV
jgi:hypothetical protein